MFDNYNTNNKQNTNAAQLNNNREQHGKNTKNNIKLEIQLKERVAELTYIGVHSDFCGDDWRSVLESRNWTALRTLYLSNTAITQIVVKSTTLVLSSSAVCTGPTFENYTSVHLIQFRKQ